jgi:hypothetical protein
MHWLSAVRARLYSGGMRALGSLLALVALFAVACGGERGTQEQMPTQPEPPAEQDPPAGDPSRPKAPPVGGTTLDGEELSLADFRGRPVLVNVWSSW